MFWLPPAESHASPLELGDARSSTGTITDDHRHHEYRAEWCRAAVLSIMGTSDIDATVPFRGLRVYLTAAADQCREVRLREQLMLVPAPLQPVLEAHHRGTDRVEKCWRSQPKPHESRCVTTQLAVK